MNGNHNLQMSTKFYNKLVRDKIPDIIKSKEQTCKTRLLEDEEYLKELRRKLGEEVQEYLDSGDLEELADIMEVIDALAVSQGSCISQVIEIQKQKQKERGGFQKRIFLESVSK